MGMAKPSALPSVHHNTGCPILAQLGWESQNPSACQLADTYLACAFTIS